MAIVFVVSLSPLPAPQTADLAGANATEEEKVLAMISQAGQGFDPSQYALQ